MRQNAKFGERHSVKNETRNANQTHLHQQMRPIAKFGERYSVKNKTQTATQALWAKRLGAVLGKHMIPF